MEIKLKKIEDPNICVPISHEEHRIERIKAEFKKCSGNSCKAEVLDMWSELNSTG